MAHYTEETTLYGNPDANSHTTSCM